MTDQDQPTARRIPVTLTVGHLQPTEIGYVIVDPGQHTGIAVAELLEETARAMRAQAVTDVMTAKVFP